mgnify:CR=1 FL=1
MPNDKNVQYNIVIRLYQCVLVNTKPKKSIPASGLNLDPVFLLFVFYTSVYFETLKMATSVDLDKIGARTEKFTNKLRQFVIQRQDFHLNSNVQRKDFAAANMLERCVTAICRPECTDFYTY